MLDTDISSSPLSVSAPPFTNFLSPQAAIMDKIRSLVGSTHTTGASWKRVNAQSLEVILDRPGGLNAVLKLQGKDAVHIVNVLDQVRHCFSFTTHMLIPSHCSVIRIRQT